MTNDKRGTILFWKHEGRVVQAAVCYEVLGDNGHITEMMYPAGCLHAAQRFFDENPTYDQAKDHNLVASEEVHNAIESQYQTDLFFDEL